MTGSSENSQSPRLYQCPVCHSLVGGRGGEEVAVCPRCGAGLEIPGEDELGVEADWGGEGPAMARLRSNKERDDGDVEEFMAEDGRVWRRRRKRKRKKPGAGHIDWEWKKKHRRSRKSLAWGAAIAVLAVAGLVGSLFFIESRRRGEWPRSGRPDPSTVGIDLGERDDVYAIPIEEIEQVVRRFLAVETVEELASLVRDPERVLPLMRDYYSRPGIALRPRACKAIGEDEAVSVKDGMCSVLVTLDDFSQREIGLEDAAEGFRVDWESWVGYSELSWKRFREEKPTRPHLFRVLLRPANYYNFEYSDESEWLCFRVKAPDDAILWGYAPADSAGLKLRAWRLGAPEERAIVRLRYAEGADRDDQVEIVQLVAEGWVLPPATPDPSF